jgi:hypothetical protein
MPAPVAIRHEPHLQAFFQHVAARGKAPLQAVVAVMRKLLPAFFRHPIQSVVRRIQVMLGTISF